MHFIIDSSEDMSCTYGEYYPHDGSITINLALIDSPYELISTIIHEIIHQCIEDTGSITTEKQDHWIIPRLLF